LIAARGEFSLPRVRRPLGQAAGDQHKRFCRMTDAPVTLETLASQLADMAGSLDVAKAEVATMAIMAVRLDVALVRLDAALNSFCREMARLPRLPADAVSGLGSDGKTG
jgi:hypothetical protein